MSEDSAGYVFDMNAYLPYLISIGFAPAGVMLLLVIVTRLENSLPSNSGPFQNSQ